MVNTSVGLRFVWFCISNLLPDPLLDSVVAQDFNQSDKLWIGILEHEDSSLQMLRADASASCLINFTRRRMEDRKPDQAGNNACIVEDKIASTRRTMQHDPTHSSQHTRCNQTKRIT